MKRPQLRHERLGATILKQLRSAQALDLTSMKRWEIANELFSLRQLRRLQVGSGEVAPREEWDAAEARLQAEMDKRPPPKPRGQR